MGDGGREGANGGVTGGDERQRARLGSSRGISLLMVVLALILIASGILYYRQQNQEETTPPRPTSPAGSLEVIDISDALQRQDLKVQVAPRAVRSSLLSVPGQGLIVDGAPLYVFVYDDVPARESEWEIARSNPSGVLPERTPFGTPITRGETHLAAGSNVIVALTGGSTEIAAKVDRAIEGLT